MNKWVFSIYSEIDSKLNALFRIVIKPLSISITGPIHLDYWVDLLTKT